MRSGFSAPRLLCWAALSALVVAMVGCSGVAGVPGTNAAQQELQNGAAGYLAQQVAEGNFVQGCPQLAFGQARCLAWGLRNVALAPLSRAVDGTTIKGYGPAQLQAAYGLTQDAKKDPGGTVAIVDAYGYPTLENDLDLYRKTFGLPTCDTASGCLQIVNQDGNPSPLPSPPPAQQVGWLGEQAIDLSMVSSNCPNCHIIMVEAATNLYTAEKTAARMHPNAISNSWGGPEYKGEKRGQFRVFYHPGIAITASSGDGGYGVIFPSSASTVTAVGGTSLNAATNSRGYSESVWRGAGSGCSAYIAAPPWQVVIEQRLRGCRNRITADVAYVASPVTGVAAYESYENDGEPPGWQVWGGTSVGSPAIAAIYALSQNTSAVPAAIAYAQKQHLYDITSGSNGTCNKAYLCNGEKGYDGPTGMGTPHGIDAF